MSDEPVRIVRLATRADRARLVGEIEAIFFAASGRTFGDPAERDAFRARWLGRYLDGDPDEVFVALTEADKAAGYLVGCLADPAQSGRFDDIPYFRDFAALTAAYPAHLHINLDPSHRGHGIGGRLIEAFVAHAAHRGAVGVHVVTGATARNRSFYARLGFAEQGQAVYGANPVVLLGRRLAGHQ